MEESEEDIQLRLAIELSLKESNQREATSEHDWQDMAFFTDANIPFLEPNESSGTSANSVGHPPRPSQKDRPPPDEVPFPSFDNQGNGYNDAGPGEANIHPDESPGQKSKSSIFHRLGSFVTEQIKQVSTKPKPAQAQAPAPVSNTVGAADSLDCAEYCRKCGQPIVRSIFSSIGTVSTSDGGMYHTDCFRCGGCQSLISGQYTIHSSSNTPFHQGCFRCMGCNEIITGLYNDYGDPPQPYHQSCRTELFAPRCCLCSHALDGQYYHHSFFENEKYCLSHESRKACFSCGRKEPLPGSNREGFVDLLDGRSLCSQCSCSIIIDSSEAEALYQSIIEYMGTFLGMSIPPEMRIVPILVVDVHSLNENLSRKDGTLGYHNLPVNLPAELSSSTINDCEPAGSTVRGLTLSTCAQVRHFPSGSMAFNQVSGALRTGRMPTLFELKEVRDVTAVLVLYGLPRDLTASILAHEAMHVWLKLNKNFPFSMPPKLEEGLCQVIAFLYLDSLVEAEEKSKTLHNTRESLREHEQDQNLRKYFSQQIRDHLSPVYGDGFREAYKIVQALGLEVMLEYVQQNHSLPDI